MKLKNVYIRFYKSFNFDYLRKFHEKVKPFPWDIISSIDGELFYPFIRIPMNEEVTTVVGANESGKSHLLSAIEKGISGQGIAREDFCRHSLFFSGKKGQRRFPDFGFEWHDFKPAVAARVREICNLNVGVELSSFWLFRFNKSELVIYWREGEEFKQRPVTNEDVVSFLPRVFRIAPNVGLPESVPLRALYDPNAQAGEVNFFSRKKRVAVSAAIAKLLESNKTGAFTLTPNAAPSAQNTEGMQAVSSLLSVLQSSDNSSGEISELQLARDLICKIADVDPSALKDLDDALREGKEGHAQAIVRDINQNLKAALNFPRFWAQDSTFELKVEARSHDLFFAIHDRTGREYSFDERSSGLKYFLSYYVQYLAHEPAPRPEMLLMDEPDTYLSSQAQQDLLKIFHGFAHPDNNRPPVQVIYVTHSPFLIDKNYGDRIRVLEKGVSDEGTRVVPNVSKNHYEPLRSAFGAFLGETTFIGNCNLMVEGIGDQILLAGAAGHLNTRPINKVAQTETLDLNQITIVPAGSASHIPYLTHLARGRDEVRPAVVVLLDSDPSGDEARKKFRQKPYSRALKDEFILQVGDLAKESGVQSATGEAPVEIEDLIPLPLFAYAARLYCREICGAGQETVDALSEQKVKDSWAQLKAAAVQQGKRQVPSVFDAIEQCFKEMPDELHVEKVGMARFVIDTVNEVARKSSDSMADKSVSRDVVTQFETNMKALFRALGRCQRAAERELSVERVGKKLERAKDAFLQDHPSHAAREQAGILLEKIESLLDDNQESDKIKIAVAAMRRDFQLEEDVTEPVPRYHKFKDSLEAVRYAERLSLEENLAETTQPVSTETQSIGVTVPLQKGTGGYLF